MSFDQNDICSNDCTFLVNYEWANQAMFDPGKTF